MFNEDSKIFDLSIIIKAIIFNIYRIIFIFILSICLWYFQISNTPNTYEINSLIKVTPPQQSAQALSSQMFYSQNRVMLEEEIEVYLSKSNLNKIVSELNLDLKINDNFYSSVLNNELFFEEYSVNLDQNMRLLNYYLIPNSDDTFNLLNSSDEILAYNLNWGDQYNDNNFSFKSIKPKVNLKEKYKLSIYSKDWAAKVNLNKSRLNLSKIVPMRTFTGNPSLLKISYIGHDIDIGQKIINTANRIYYDNSIKKNSSEAKKSLAYIDDQINVVGQKLRASEDKLNKFRIKNTSIDFSIESLALLEQSEAFTSKLNQIELEEVEAKNFYQSGNPILLRLESQKNTISKQLTEVNNKIKELPSNQQEFISLTRNVEANKKIYEQLLNRQLEVSLLEASTLGNIDIIDEAYVSRKVGPRRLNSLFLTLIFASLISLTYAIVRHIFFSPIQLPSDITQSTSKQMLGIIKKMDPNEIKLISSNAYEAESGKEEIDSYITNLSMIKPSEPTLSRATKIIITGATPKVGKTTISLLTSKYLSMREKKVLLIDCDYRRGDLNKIFDKSTLKDRLIDIYNSDNLEDYKINDSLYFIPRPFRKSNKSYEVFQSQFFKNFIVEQQKNFDYIIFDTAPTLSLSDSIILSDISDIIIGVLRHKYTKIDELRSMDSEYKIVNKKIDYVVYNCFEKPSGYYSYDYYAYKYYGGYYEYEEDNS